MMKIIKIYCLLFAMRLFAWYPDYTVMATDFVLPYDFLKPTSFQTVGLKTLGEHFLYLSRNPVDDIFQNPAYLGSNKGQLIYVDIAGEYFNREQESGVMPMNSYYEKDLASTDVIQPPYYWSPYRDTNEPAEDEPLVSLFYTLKIGGKSKPIGLGFSYEYFFDQLEFYQPYWYWYGWWGYDAFGGSFSSQRVNQYPDRLIDFNDNTLTDSGHRINTFLSYDITKSLTAGLRYGILNKNSDGNYTNINRRTDIVLYDDYSYLYYDEVLIHQDQKYAMSDLSFGLLWNKNESNLGISIGYNFGEINRDYLETDTSNYSSYNFYGPDTINYSDHKSHSSSVSDREWNYNGNTLYGNLHGKYKLNKDATINWSINSENRTADLIEEELMNRYSYYKSYNYSTWDSTLWKSSNISFARIDRSGSGEYSFKRNRFSIGVDLIVSPKIRFIGGLVIDHRSDKKNADEPLIGRKYSSSEGNNYDEFSTHTWDQNDDKRYLWYRNDLNRIVAVPTGFIFRASEQVEVRFGITKIFKKVDIDEGYDLIVNHETITQTENDTSTTTSKSDYTEGYTFPGIQNFNSKFLFNAGVSIKYHDRIRITCAIKESLFKPSYFKISAELSF